MNTQMERPRGHTTQQQDPPHNVSLHSGEGHDGKERHGEKKSVLKKVKAKARKIKDTIKGHVGHGNELNHDHEDDDHEGKEMPTDPQFHDGAPAGGQSVLPGREGVPGHRGTKKGETATMNKPSGSYQTTNPNTALKHHPGEDEILVRSSRTDARNLTGQDEQPYAPKNTPVAAHPIGGRRTAIDEVFDVPTTQPRGYQTFDPSPVAPTSGGIVGGILEGDTALEKDPHAPKGIGEARDPENYQTKVTDPTGKGTREIEIDPMLNQLDKMTRHEESGRKPKQDPHLGAEHDEKARSYGEAISTVTAKIADKATKAKDVVATKLGYGGVTHEEQLEKPGAPEPPRPGAGSSIGEYGWKVAATVHEKLAPVYEKLKPREEEKALSEVIAEALPSGKGNDLETSKGGGVSVKGRVTESEEVKKRLGPFEEMSEEDVGGTGVGRDAVHWMKESAASWFGKGGQISEPSSQGSSEPSKGG